MLRLAIDCEGSGTGTFIQTRHHTRPSPVPLDTDTTLLPGKPGVPQKRNVHQHPIDIGRMAGSITSAGAFDTHRTLGSTCDLAKLRFSHCLMTATSVKISAENGNTMYAGGRKPDNRGFRNYSPCCPRSMETTSRGRHAVSPVLEIHFQACAHNALAFELGTVRAVSTSGPSHPPADEAILFSFWQQCPLMSRILGCRYLGRTYFPISGALPCSDKPPKVTWSFPRCRGWRTRK